MALKMSAAALYRISAYSLRPLRLCLSSSSAAAAACQPGDCHRTEPTPPFKFLFVCCFCFFVGTRTNINAKSKGRLKELMWALLLSSSLCLFLFLCLSLSLPVLRSCTYLRVLALALSDCGCCSVARVLQGSCRKRCSSRQEGGADRGEGSRLQDPQPAASLFNQSTSYNNLIKFCTF